VNFEDVGRYRLTVSSTSFMVLCPKGTDKFSGRATSDLPKLYVISADDHPIPFYVGITKQPMRNRLRFGWDANGKGGYYGYAWRHHMTQANLDLWCHTDPPVERPCLDAETIEAELVFMIRKAGQWPLHQTEIHFHPSTDVHRVVAARIGARYGL
jgi:hypothetical protein